MVKLFDKEVNNKSIEKAPIQDDSILSGEHVEKQCKKSTVESTTIEPSIAKPVRDEKVVRKSFEEIKTRKNINEVIIEDEPKLDVRSVKKQLNINANDKCTYLTPLEEKITLNAGVVSETPSTRVTKKCTNEISIQKFESFEGRISFLENNMKLLFKRCETLENENKVLVKRLREDEEKQKEKKHIEMDEIQNGEEILLNQKKRGFKRVGPYAQSEPRITCSEPGLEFSRPGV